LPATLAFVPDSLAPALLVAMPQLLDPNFRRSVVLLIHHDAEGTFGVVLNRTTEIRASQLCESIEIDWHGDPRAEIHWGGPVQPQTGWVLFEGDAAVEDDDEDVREVVPGIGFAGSLAVLRRMASEPPDRLRILLGYAGWGPGQLESELAQGAWLVAPADPAVLFGTELDAMWTRVVRSLGIEPATLVASRGVH
jgi:putative transcriptional regulator